MKKFLVSLLCACSLFNTTVSAENIASLAITGSAVEDGGDMPMTAIAPGGVFNGRFVGYISLSPGSYSFVGKTTNGQAVTLGVNGEKLVTNGEAAEISEPQLVRLIADTHAEKIEITPLTSLAVKGSIVPDGTTLDYVGRGVWQSTVNLDKSAAGEYLSHNIYFAFNNDDALAVRRLPQSASVGSVADGYSGENIRLNNGTYTLTLDMSTHTFNIDGEVNPYRISMFGSSVANGQGAENLHGYAYLYGRQLEQRTKNNQSEYPLEISGIAIGGNTTTSLLNRYDDMLHDFGHYVMIGLSLGNEGIHETGDPEGVFAGFRDNMLKLISKMRADGKEPVIVNNYTRGDYTDRDYSYIKRMNMLIHSWDVPSVNVLGAIDDGAGHWAAGYIQDNGHPNTNGHKEFMYAIVPSLFDALVDGKPLPKRDLTQSCRLNNSGVMKIQAEGTLHSFTLDVRVKGNDEGTLLSFENGSRRNYIGSLTVNADGSITYNSPQKESFTTEPGQLSDGNWHDVALTHYYAQGRTFLYVDGKLTGSTKESLIPGEFTIGDAKNQAVSRDFSEVSFWRSGMTQQELQAHHDGSMMKSSLEIYSPMKVVNGTVANQAQSLNSITLSHIEDNIVSVSKGRTLKVEGGRGEVTLAGGNAETISMVAPDGRTVVNVAHDGTTTSVSLPCGIYIINGQKVAVR